MYRKEFQNPTLRDARRIAHKAIRQDSRVYVDSDPEVDTLQITRYSAGTHYIYVNPKFLPESGYATLRILDRLISKLGPDWPKKGENQENNNASSSGSDSARNQDCQNVAESTGGSGGFSRNSSNSQSGLPGSGNSDPSVESQDSSTSGRESGPQNCGNEPVNNGQIGRGNAGLSRDSFPEFGDFAPRPNSGQENPEHNITRPNGPGQDGASLPQFSRWMRKIEKDLQSGNPDRIARAQNLLSRLAQFGDYRPQATYNTQMAGSTLNLPEVKKALEDIRKNRLSRKLFEELSRLCEVKAGAYGKESPRISKRKLLKQILKKSYNLSQTKKQELERNTVIITVDTSPSCSEVCNSLLAVALTVAGYSSNIIVVENDNGYPYRVNGKNIRHLSLESDTAKRIWKEIFQAHNSKRIFWFGDGDGLEFRKLIAELKVEVFFFDHETTHEEEFCKMHLLGIDSPQAILREFRKLEVVNGELRKRRRRKS
jgi:hypothetical protein